MADAENGGSVSEVDYPDGRSQTVNATDPKSGTPTNVTLPNGQSQNQTLNSRGQQQTQNGAGVLPARFTYDDKTGAMTGMNLFQSGTFDGTPETTAWTYDPATGLLTKKTYNDGTSDIYDYNAKFQLTRLTRPGVFINYHYDASGRQTTTDATDNASGLTVTDSVGAYDDQGRPTSVTQTTSDAGGETQSTATNTYSYDKNGNLASETQAAGVTTVYNYYSPTDDSSTAEPGALENVKLVQGGHVISETDYYYSPSSKRLASITVLAYQNGTVAASQDFTYTYKSGTNLVESITAGEVKTTYGYEAATGRLSSIATTSTSTDPISTLYDAEYTYFNNDQRKTESVTQLDSDGNTNSHNWTFGYDAQNELINVTNTGSGTSVYSYGYDGVGNRNDSAFTSTYGIANGLNQYANLTYNARGDLVDDGIYHYTWNALDQLVGETPDHPTAGSQKEEMQYDAEARRTEVDSYNWNDTTGQWDDEADKVLKYVYQGSQLAAELDGNNNPIVTLARGADGTLISITDYTSGTPHIYVVLQDATSNTVGLANPTNGAVVASFQYAPFGAFTSDNGSEVNTCPEMFAGMIYDGNAALPYYAWHRYYSPSEGRWISRDPSDEQGGLNLDEYAGDDPIDNTDSAGLNVVPAGSTHENIASPRPLTPRGEAWNAAKDVVMARLNLTFKALPGGLQRWQLQQWYFDHYQPFHDMSTALAWQFENQFLAAESIGRLQATQVTVQSSVQVEVQSQSDLHQQSHLNSVSPAQANIWYWTHEAEAGHALGSAIMSAEIIAEHDSLAGALWDAWSNHIAPDLWFGLYYSNESNIFGESSLAAGPSIVRGQPLLEKVDIFIDSPSLVLGSEWFDNFARRFGPENVEWTSGSGRTIDWPDELPDPGATQMFRVRPAERSSTFASDLGKLELKPAPDAIAHHVRPLGLDGSDDSWLNGSWEFDPWHQGGHTSLNSQLNHLPYGTEIRVKPD